MESAKYNELIAKIKTLDSSLSDDDIKAVITVLYSENSGIESGNVTADKIKDAKKKLNNGKLLMYGGIGAAVLLVLAGGSYIWFSKGRRNSRVTN